MATKTQGMSLPPLPPARPGGGRTLSMTPSQVSAVPGSEYVQRTNGETLGPLSRDQLKDLVRSGQLQGDEGVSVDGTYWVPIMAVPDVAAVFREKKPAGGTLYGKAAFKADEELRFPGRTEESAVTELSESELDLVGMEPRANAPAVPGPLSSSGLGVPAAGRSSGMASGSWAAFAEQSSPGFPNAAMGTAAASNAVAPEPSAGGGDLFEGLSGIRRLSPDSGSLPVAASASGFPGLTPMAPGTSAELPVPRGFTNYPMQAPPNLAAEMEAMDEAELPTAADLRSELPAPRGWTQPDMAPQVDWGAELPVAAKRAGGSPLGEDAELPTAALWGGAELPAPSPWGGAELPAPGQAPELPSPLRQSPSLPKPSAPPLPGGGGRGTQMMSALDSSSPRVAPPKLPTAAPAFGGTLQSPSSGNTRDLAPGGGGFGDSAGDDLWAGGGGPVTSMPKVEPMNRLGGGANPTQGFGGLEEPQIPSASVFDGGAPGSDDPWAARPAEGGGDSSGFGEFFGGAQPQEQPAGMAPAPAAAPVSPSARARGGAGYGTKIALLAALLIVLGGAAFFLSVILSTDNGDDTHVVSTPDAGQQQTVVAAVDLESISELRRGGYRLYEQYIQTARQAAVQSRTPDARASLLIADALLFVEHPERTDVRAEMTELFDNLATADATPLVQLARGAYLSAAADPNAQPVLALLATGELAAWAQLFTGLYGVQVYRGIDFHAAEAEAPPAPAPTPGSGEAAGGSGDAAPAPGAPSAPVLANLAPEDSARSTEFPAGTMEAFDAAIAADPGFASPRYWRGWAALQLNEAEAAERFLSQALETNPEHVAAIITLSRAMLKRGALADADARINRAVDDLESQSSRRERSETFLVSAEISIARFQPELAIESLLSALQSDPTNGQALRTLGEQFYRAGQYERAVEYFQTNSDLGENDPESALGLIKSLIGLANYDRAQAELESAIVRFPRDSRFPYYLGRVFEERAEFDRSRELYRQAMQVDPNFLRPYVRLAQLAQRANDPLEALHLLDEASSSEINSAVIANEIGETYLALGQTNRAVSSFILALSLDHSNPDAQLNLITYYLDTLQFEQSLQQLDRMIAAGVDTPRLRYLHARALHGMGQFDRAIEEMIALLDADPDNSNYLYLLGLVHFDAGNYAVAREKFSRALEESPGLSDALYRIGRCDIELGSYNEAISALTTVSARAESGEYHYWLGFALERAEQVTQALSEYTRGIDNDIAWSLENPEVFYRRGRLYFFRGVNNAAYRDLRTILTLIPDHAPGSWMLGRVFYDQREFARAIQLMQHSLDIDPAQPEVAYYMGNAYLALERPEPVPALRFLEQARDGGYGEQRPELFQQLAYVYRDSGSRDQAIASFRAYIERAQLSNNELREMQNEIRRLGGTP